MTLSFLFAQNSDLVFRSNSIAEVYITVDTSTLSWVYASENLESDSLHMSSISFQNENLDITMDSVGFRLRETHPEHRPRSPLSWILTSMFRDKIFAGLKNSTLKQNRTTPP